MKPKAVGAKMGKVSGVFSASKSGRSGVSKSAFNFAAKSLLTVDWESLFARATSAGVAFLIAVTALTVAPLPVRAADGDGGAGSAGQSGGGATGAGGANSQNGGPGGNATLSGAGGGGGGGGGTGATTGGAGGNGFGGAAGGAAGADGTSTATSNAGAGGGGGGSGGGVSITDSVPTALFTVSGPGTSPNGGGGGTGGNAAGTAADGGGGGGGGGGGIELVVSNKTSITTNGTLVGGNGGNGGGGGTAASGNGGNGGNGGAGSTFLVETGTTSFTNNGTVVGGNGGNGGAGGSGTANGGNGGNGGGGSTSLTMTGSATLTNYGTLIGGNGGTAGAGGTGTITNGFAGTAGAGGAGLTASGVTIINDGTISGGLANGGTGARANAITFTGGANTLMLQSGWALNGDIGVTGSLTFNQSIAVDVSNVISGSGSVIQNGAGMLTLSGANTYTGATTVSSGTLEVDGSIAGTSSVTVNSGATLAGIGVVDPITTTINSGGTLAPGTPGTPGTFLTITGNLAFQSGAIYAISLNPAASTFTVVTGTASLAGTVNASFASGTYLTKQYDILQSAGLGGTKFATVTTAGLPSGFTTSLSYSTTDAFLNLTATLGQTLSTSGLNVNQQNVANTLNSFFNSGGALPPNFVSIFGFTDATLANALSQLTGEDATGAERGAFDLMNEFLGLMLDPFVYGRGGDQNTGGALGFARDQQTSLPPDIALAYAALLKAAPKQTFEQRWTTWTAGFGGSATTNGNLVIGSNNVTTSTYGYAAGLDYHYSPDTIFGFSLAGGGTNWNLAQGLGTGRSEAFLAGVYGVTHEGPAYLAAALAFANNWFTANRTALGDQLSASFQGQSYSARLEGGYRFAVPMYHNAVGVTPYAALQAQDFHTPAYNETDLTGGGFGLSYNAMSGTDARSELGARFDDLTALANLPLILRAKVAWAHDWVSNPALSASFETLPGSSFTVNGAPIPHNSALTSAGAQLFFTPNWSFTAKFDGEFASGSELYAGSGTLRYTW